MNALINFGIKDLFFIIFFVGMMGVSFVLFMEMKLYFQVDIAGVDIPLDEWYERVFK